MSYLDMESLLRTTTFPIIRFLEPRNYSKLDESDADSSSSFSRARQVFLQRLSTQLICVLDCLMKICNILEFLKRPRDFQNTTRSLPVRQSVNQCIDRLRSPVDSTTVVSTRFVMHW